MEFEVDITSALSNSCRRKIGWAVSVNHFLVYVTLENITIYQYCFIQNHSYASFSLQERNDSFAKTSWQRNLEVVVIHIEFGFCYHSSQSFQLWIVYYNHLEVQLCLNVCQMLQAPHLNFYTDNRRNFFFECILYIIFIELSVN